VRLAAPFINQKRQSGCFAESATVDYQGLFARARSSSCSAYSFGSFVIPRLTASQTRAANWVGSSIRLPSERKNKYYGFNLLCHVYLHLVRRICLLILAICAARSAVIFAVVLRTSRRSALTSVRSASISFRSLNMSLFSVPAIAPDQSSSASQRTLSHSELGATR